MKNERFVLAYDFGTGGCKSSIYHENGDCIAEDFASYQTFYPFPKFHEQRPEDWWCAVKDSTRQLTRELGAEIVNNICAIGISGHSLGMLPLDRNKKPLMDSVPIWSDARAEEKELDCMFSNIPENDWYMMTGNGFPASLYTVFKVLWLKHNKPEVFDATETIIGTKDYINLLLTGKIYTDYSYASGSGVYDLNHWQYSDDLLKNAGLKRSLFPEIVASSQIIGTLLPEIADELGLPSTVKVVCGGVDNSCMALGAKCIENNRAYNSLGSSSWIAVSSDQPVLDSTNRPYVFAHVIPELFVSATSIFAAGSSYRWFKETLWSDVDYEHLNKLAKSAPVGSNGVIFNPTLSGGTCIDPSPNTMGGFMGLRLSTSNADMSRSVLEGVSMGLKVALDVLKLQVPIDEKMLVVGGGSKGDLWCQVLSDCYRMQLVRSNINEQAAALGAAALAFVGVGIWPDYSKLEDLHIVQSILEPDLHNTKVYEKLMPLYQECTEFLAKYGDYYKNNLEQ